MTRLPAVFLAGLLLIGRPAISAEFQPADYYSAAFTVLGSVGGAALGASIAGLSRPTGSSSVRPFMQWGSVGAVTGAMLGRDLAHFSLDSESDIPGPKPVSTREANACLGALGGQLAGYAMVAVINDPIHRNDRTVWAGVALGTLAGAAIGYFLPPIPLLTLPPEQSRKERIHEINTTQLEPLIPVGKDAAVYLSASESVPATNLSPTRPFLPASKLTKLDTILMTPENDRMIDSYSPVFPIEPPTKTKPVLASLNSTQNVDTAPAMQLTALAGFCLGSAFGASMGGSRNVMMTRMGVVGAAGMVGGWAYARSELSPSRGMTDEELEEIGIFLSNTSAWTIAGTMIGIGSGAVFRNNFKDFGISDAAHVTLGFAWLGMVGGAFSTSF